MNLNIKYLIINGNLISTQKFEALFNISLNLNIYYKIVNNFNRI